MSGQRLEIESIQCLRALAAGTVICAHAFAHLLSQPPLWPWTAGRIGVTLFFVISGFIMTVITPEGRFDPWDFLVRRLLRICPLYWFITVLVGAMAWLGLPFFRHTVFDAAHFIGSLLFIPMERPGNPGHIEPFVKLGWTLNYEMFFYLCFTALCFLNRTQRTIVLCALMVGLATLGRLVDFENPIARFVTGYDVLGFAAGAVVGLVYCLRPGLVAASWRALGLLCLASTAVLVAAAAGLTDNYPSMWLQAIVVTFSATTLLATVAMERAGAWPRLRALERFGSASYSAYLFHMFPIGALAVIAPKLLGAEPAGLAYLAFGLAGLASGLAAGWITYVVIERPLLRIARRFTPVPVEQAVPKGG
ncbi:acyltransferase family protein [Amaricoccus solimangrovi]|uniref:Acyltransferase n=1 Tax=Amaricoccus solimangrovi TaxID=2589815 RepID=A0A501WEB5_9RHOB|nr:acyltransferase [Amaricoccus solimangrovi]TPE48173.1 acyltransferase [Amaricoccus solimangrovi]